MLPLFSVFLHFLQCFDYIFKFHEVRSLYEDGISRFHICVQVLKKAFQIFFPDDCQVWIGLRCLSAIWAASGPTQMHASILH